MQYRMLRTADLPQFRDFEAYCFQVPEADLERYMQHKFQIDLTRGLFAEDGQMMAMLTNIPFELHMDGARIGMGGIAGVASVPENRRGGHVGQLLVHALRETREQGLPLSGLYPFKQSFYRHYGWEVSCAWLEHDLPISLLSDCQRTAGVFRRYRSGEAETQPLVDIYTRWAEGKRGYMVRNGERHWRDWVDPTIWPQWAWTTATWQPSAGAAPEGYVMYRFEKGDDGKTFLRVKELIALTREAERSLWGFVANHDSQVKSVRFRTQRDYPLWHLVENTYEVKSTLQSSWMLRLVDLQAAFAARPWPVDARGSLTIAVTDEQAPWNQGTWRLAFEAGRASVQPAPADTAALSANIQTWSQLYAGFVRPEQAVHTGRLAVHDPAALKLLQQITAGPGMVFYEGF